MPSVISKDGTKIAYSKSGSGPTLVLVDGALCYRDFGPSKALADLLQNQFTVYIYDRRGRGESGDTQPYSLQREIDDIEAIASVAKEPIYLFGQSSGGVLALEAANRLGGQKVRKVAAYETPLFVDTSRKPLPPDFMDRLHRNLQNGQNGKAVKQFMTLVGTPRFFVAIMPLMPMWKKLKAVAPTLAYDFDFMKDMQQGKPVNSEQWARVAMPALALVGGKSPVWMQNTMKQVADVLPNASFSIAEGQTHMVKSSVLVPLLVDFFTSSTATTAVPTTESERA